MLDISFNEDMHAPNTQGTLEHIANMYIRRYMPVSYRYGR